MACNVHMSVLFHTTAPCGVSLFGVCLRCFCVPIWMNIRTCGCLMAPHGGITSTTPVFLTPHHTLSSSYNLVRAPRPLCRYRPPTRESHGAATHRLHTVPSVHRFIRAPLALSQVTLCQSRSLRPPHNSPLPSSLELLHLLECSPAAPATHPHPTSGCRHADFSTHRCPTRRLYPTSARGVLSQMRPPA